MIFDSVKKNKLIRVVLHIVTAAVLLAGMLDAGTAAAVGPVVLTITAISSDGTRQTLATFDRETLSNMREYTIATKTPWTDGLVEFSGPLLRDVIAAGGAPAKHLYCKALNDYSADIPVEDALNNQVILAMKMNGTLMSVREKGPLWVIYPWTGNPALWTESHFARSVWQLKEIELRN